MISAVRSSWRGVAARALRASIPTTLAALAASCGGDGSSPVEPEPFGVVISPATAEVLVGAGIRFSANWRFRATAVKLRDGEVLIVGGNNSGGPVLPADLFR